jgi:glucose/arabinose dehydrogenase
MMVLRAGILATSVLAMVLTGSAPLPPGFRQEVVVAGLHLPTTWVQPPDPTVQYIAEKSGVVRVASRGRLLPNPLVDLSKRVNDVGDRGLLGMALDPDFAANGYLYLAYTFEDPAVPVTNPSQTQRVTRVTVDIGSHTADPASEIVVLGRVRGAACWDAWRTRDCLPSNLPVHTVNDLAFDAKGHLWVSVGDGGAPGYNDDAVSFRAQDIQVLAGKILRIDPVTGRGVRSNPFFEPGRPRSNASRVYAYGFRNPFRFTFRPGSGTPYVGDVGSSHYEEIDVVRAGANYGWPCYEGPKRQPHFSSYRPCRRMYEARTPVVRPAAYYPPPEGVSITGGVFYPGGVYPAGYAGTYVYGDYGAFVRRQRFSGVDAAVGSPIGLVSKKAAGAPVQFRVGPDGNIWYLSIYPGELRRIVYTGTESVPSSCPDGRYRAEYFNTPDLQGSPAVVRCEQSINHDWGVQAPLPGVAVDDFSVRWTGRIRHAGGTHRFAARTDNGVRLAIDDVIQIDRWVDGPVRTRQADVLLPEGVHTVVMEYYHRADSAFARLRSRRVGTAPVVRVTSPTDRTRVRAGSTVAFSVSATDQEDGVLPASAVGVDIAFRHYTSATTYHVHPYRTHDGTTSGKFRARSNHGPGLYQVVARATDSSGWSTRSSPVRVCLAGNRFGPCR